MIGPLLNAADILATRPTLRPLAGDIIEPARVPKLAITPAGPEIRQVIVPTAAVTLPQFGEFPTPFGTEIMANFGGQLSPQINGLRRGVEQKLISGGISQEESNFINFLNARLPGGVSEDLLTNSINVIELLHSVFPQIRGQTIQF